jgi:Uma2 family endonuclease
MVPFKPLPALLTEDDLPETDNQPVDNELQVLLPIVLRAILSLLWADRSDWFMGVNLGFYYDPALPAIGPDAFLSLGVPRYKRDRGRLSYVLTQEKVIPQWVLEMVSQTPGGEYDEKFQTYAAIGILYYVIYNPYHFKRDGHDRFEVYRLDNGVYVRQPVQQGMVWMPDIGLGIGCGIGQHEGLRREWLYWYDQAGNRHPAPENVIEQERQLRAALEQQLEQTEQQLEQTEQQLEQTEQQLEQTEQQLEQTEQQLEQERQLRSQTEQQLQQLLEWLRQRGINPGGAKHSSENP